MWWEYFSHLMVTIGVILAFVSFGLIWSVLFV